MTDLKIRINKAWWFIKLDLRDAFNLIRIKQENEWKTTFRTKYGLFEYLIMSFELINALTTLQRAVNKALYDYLNVFVIIYMNDVLIFSETREKHEVHVTKVLQRFQEHNLRVKKKKFKFLKQQITFLEYVIKLESIIMKSCKLKVI